MKGFRWLKNVNPFDALATRAGRKATEGAIDAVVDRVLSQEIRPMTNWKTGLPGILMLVASVLSAVAKIMAGTAPGVDDMAGIAGGVGLLAAKDKDVTGAGVTATRQP